MTGSWLLPAVILLPLLGSLALLVAGPAADRWARPFGVVVTGGVLVLVGVVVVGFDQQAAERVQWEFDAPWVPELGLRLHLGVDGISLPLLALTALLTFLCAVYTLRHLPEPGRPRAFVGLLLLLLVGMVGTFVALDLLLFFVFFEIVLIPMWFVIAVWGSGERRHSANLFIVYTLAGSVIMVLGFLLIALTAGTTDMLALAAQQGSGLSSSVQLAAVLLIGVGLAVKAPMWPFHSWLPDAHTAAPTVGSVLLAGVLLKMGTYGLVRIALPVAPEGARTLAPYLATLAVVGIVYGGLLSYAQRDLKRLVAFSSVGHMGFVLLGIATLDTIGVNGALFGNIAHGLITGLLFFLVGGIKERYGTTDLDALPGGLYSAAPRLGFLLGFAAVASLGLPGLAGFWGEFLPLVATYQPAVDARGLYRVLLVVAAAGTLLAVAYFLRVLRRVGQGDGPVAPTRDLSVLEGVCWTPLAVLILLFGLVPGLLLGLSGPAVQETLAPRAVVEGEP